MKRFFLLVSVLVLGAVRCVALDLTTASIADLQAAFRDRNALQCGYCTPGMLMSATALLRENGSPSEDEIRKALQGNICRCTGYVNIVEAIKAVAK